MRLQDNKKGCRVKKNYSLMLYQRVMGDFYPINSEGKFTLSANSTALARPFSKCYYKIVRDDGADFRCLFIFSG